MAQFTQNTNFDLMDPAQAEVALEIAQYARQHPSGTGSYAAQLSALRENLLEALHVAPLVRLNQFLQG